MALSSHCQYGYPLAMPVNYIVITLPPRFYWLYIYATSCMETILSLTLTRPCTTVTSSSEVETVGRKPNPPNSSSQFDRSYTGQTEKITSGEHRLEIHAQI